MNAQENLYHAVRRTLKFTSDEGKTYELDRRIATLVVRPRGWHLVEKSMVIDDQPMSGSLFDFGLYFFHNAKELLARGSGLQSVQEIAVNVWVSTRPDNAAAESFFATLKKELVYRTVFPTRKKACDAVAEYISNYSTIAKKHILRSGIKPRPKHTSSTKHPRPPNPTVRKRLGTPVVL